MASVDPLSPAEQAFWRALMMVVLSLPRRLDSDLVRASAITANEYQALMSLSEALGSQLRMSDLAGATGLSPSRITRLVDDLQSRGMVTKRASPKDRRGNVAKLSPAGLAKLRSAWKVHLHSARSLVFDQLDPVTMSDAARALSEIAAGLQDTA